MQLDTHQAHSLLYYGQCKSEDHVLFLPDIVTQKKALKTLLKSAENEFSTLAQKYNQALEQHMGQREAPQIFAQMCTVHKNLCDLKALKQERADRIKKVKQDVLGSHGTLHKLNEACAKQASQLENCAHQEFQQWTRRVASPQAEGKERALFSRFFLEAHQAGKFQAILNAGDKHPKAFLEQFGTTVDQQMHQLKRDLILGKELAAWSQWKDLSAFTAQVGQDGRFATDAKMAQGEIDGLKRSLESTFTYLSNIYIASPEQFEEAHHLIGFLQPPVVAALHELCVHYGDQYIPELKLEIQEFLRKLYRFLADISTEPVAGKKRELDLEAITTLTTLLLQIQPDPEHRAMVVNLKSMLLKNVLLPNPELKALARQLWNTIKPVELAQKEATSLEARAFIDEHALAGKQTLEPKHLENLQIDIPKFYQSLMTHIQLAQNVDALATQPIGLILIQEAERLQQAIDRSLASLPKTAQERSPQQEDLRATLREQRSATAKLHRMLIKETFGIGKGLPGIQVLADNLNLGFTLNNDVVHLAALSSKEEKFIELMHNKLPVLGRAYNAWEMVEKKTRALPHSSEYTPRKLHIGKKKFKVYDCQQTPYKYVVRATDPAKVVNLVDKYAKNELEGLNFCASIVSDQVSMFEEGWMVGLIVTVDPRAIYKTTPVDINSPTSNPSRPDPRAEVLTKNFYAYYKRMVVLAGWVNDISQHLPQGQQFTADFEQFLRLKTERVRLHEQHVLDGDAYKTEILQAIDALYEKYQIPPEQRGQAEDPFNNSLAEFQLWGLIGHLEREGDITGENFAQLFGRPPLAQEPSLLPQLIQARQLMQNLQDSTREQGALAGHFHKLANPIKGPQEILAQTKDKSLMGYNELNIEMQRHGGNFRPVKVKGLLLSEGALAALGREHSQRLVEIFKKARAEGIPVLVHK